MTAATAPDRKTYHRIILVLSIALLLIGTAFKVHYPTQVGHHISSHDLWYLQDWENADPQIEGLDYSGHLGYIQYLYLFHELPHSYENQLYHPPLYHLMGAVLIYLGHDVRGYDYIVCLELLQVLTMWIACLGPILIFLILLRLPVRGLPFLCGTAAASFTPLFYNMGAALNNDALATVLGIAAIFFCLLWIQTKKTWAILLTALAIGLGMLTKLIVGLVALPIGVVFVWRLIESIRKKEGALPLPKLLKQYLLFAVFCTPLGVAWSIRNYVAFGIPFHYVYNPNYATMSVAKATLWHRLGLPSLHQLTTVRPYLVGLDESNIWGQTWLTASFDEGVLNNKEGIARMISIPLVWLTGILSILMHILGIRALVSRKNGLSPVLKTYLGVGCYALLAYYIRTCFTYSITSTMSARYVALSLVFLLCLYTAGCAQEKEKGGAPLRVLTVLSYIVIAAYAALSTFVYFQYGAY